MIDNFIQSKRILYWTGLLIFLAGLEPSLSTHRRVSVNNFIVNHDKGSGLYSGFNKVTKLDQSNFQSIVFGNETRKMWLVEFYMIWCGDCQRFVHTWKTLATDIFGWRDVVELGVVECSNDANVQLCRDFGVKSFPTVKLFTPHSPESVLGEHFEEGTADKMRSNIVKRLKTYQKSRGKSGGRVKLNPVTNVTVDETLWTDFPSKVLYVVFVFEAQGSLVGAEVALDLSRVKEVKMMLVNFENVDIIQQIGLVPGFTGYVALSKSLKIKNLYHGFITREKLRKSVVKFLVSEGINVPSDYPSVENGTAVHNNTSNFSQIIDEIKHKLNITDLSTVVFQRDLESAVHFSLGSEVPLSKVISGNQLSALKNFLHVLIKYFPSIQQEQQFLMKLMSLGIGNKTKVFGEEFRQTFRQLEGEYRLFWLDQGWIGCHGSKPRFRGYNCGLWTLFHTLIVHEALKDGNKPGKNPEVLNAMVGYIKNFFSCKNCADHFGKMAETIVGNVTTQKDSVMWLWAAHNSANKRLAGDYTEDPEHQKIQFPDNKACPSCRVGGETWDKTEVFNYLSNMYTDIILLDDTFSPLTTTTTTSS